MKSKISTLTITILIGIVFLLSCKSNSSKEKLVLAEGKVGLIGYGSLTSKKQMEHQLGRKYEDEVKIVHLNGYKRNWSMVYPNNPEFPPVNQTVVCLVGMDTIIPENIVAMDIVKSENDKMNCCLFIVDVNDLPIVDRTEKSYKRINVTDKIDEFRIEGGPVYAYQGLKEYTKEPISQKPEKNAIVQIYLDFLTTGFDELGSEYKREFDESTNDYDKSLVLECILQEN